MFSRLHQIVLAALIASFAAPALASENDSGKERWHVVVDPGHGGVDRGAEIEGSIVEKEITLDIARRVAAILKSKGSGTRVTLTRDRDRSVPLAARARVARERGIDLFISIHANASNDPTAFGAEVYFLSLEHATDDAAEALAEFENAALFGDDEAAGGDDGAGSSEELQSIVLDVARGETVERSSALAEMVVDAFRSARAVPERGVKQADFAVLRSVTAPSILVEVGFVTNPEEAERLAKGSYRQRIAEGIALGAENFLSREAGIAPLAYYFVRDGDTLTTVAHRHGTTADELARMNGLAIGRLTVGQRLRVPR
ncbi:MAG: N-acetylmuramoyl-L-alanine amidase [bacterium]